MVMWGRTGRTLNLETEEVTATVTPTQLGNDGKRGYLYIENQSANTLLFGFGETEPSSLHKLGANLAFEWLSDSCPTGKIWLASDSGTASVIITQEV